MFHAFIGNAALVVEVCPRLYRLRNIKMINIPVRYVFFLWTFFIVDVTVTARHDDKIPFQWTSCGNSSDPIQINHLQVYQNDSNYMYVTGDGIITSDIESPISGKVEMTKNVLGLWIPIPCIDDVGTCSYPDICHLSPYKTDCPKIYTDQNLPCHCPIPRDAYSFESFPVPINILPKWLERGIYSIKVTLRTAGKRSLCLKMIISF